MSEPGARPAIGGQRAPRPGALPQYERDEGWLLSRAAQLLVQRVGVRRGRRLHERPALNDA